MNLKEFQNYLQEPTISQNFDTDCLGTKVEKVYESGVNDTLEGVSLALIGVDEFRASQTNYNCGGNSDAIRSKLFDLMKHDSAGIIADLGNLKLGNTTQDTCTAISNISAELIRNKIVPIIFGPSQDVTFAQYEAYKQLAQIINLVNVDSRFDLGTPNDDLHAQSYVGKIILEQPNFLFNYSHIGYQTYYVGDNAVSQMSKLYFDTYRLGHVTTDIADMEPVLRNSDMISFDLSAIKSADAKASLKPGPNGLSGAEACQLMYYAGMSEKLSSVGIYNYVNQKDDAGLTAELAAQMIWYFIEAFFKRKNEMPQYNKNGFLKYTVPLHSTNHELIFLKSTKSDRWWMEIPIADNYTKLQRHHIVPCSHNDYLMACSNEMPVRWWQAYQKLC
ncbi:MAG: formimidoylglutamase [Bacteroidia bacterium]|nr:formimidoylglutamase [Bacteroidia bacterium]HQV00352.1 formimidoylglutamase [Bacteroidia bacterium]